MPLVARGPGEGFQAAVPGALPPRRSSSEAEGVREDTGPQQGGEEGGGREEDGRAGGGGDKQAERRSSIVFMWNQCLSL